MTDVIFKYSNETAFQNRLNAIGHGAHDDAEKRHKLRRQVGLFLGHPTTDINGDAFQRARMSAEDADKFPPANNPAFAIVWRSDEFENDELLPEPQVEVEALDVDGNPDGTRMQGVGAF